MVRMFTLGVWGSAGVRLWFFCFVFPFYLFPSLSRHVIFLSCVFTWKNFFSRIEYADYNKVHSSSFATQPFYLTDSSRCYDFYIYSDIWLGSVHTYWLPVPEVYLCRFMPHADLCCSRVNQSGTLPMMYLPPWQREASLPASVISVSKKVCRNRRV